MNLAPRLRKFVLTTHVVSSVGWLGAAATYLALAIFVLTEKNPQLVRAGVLAMKPIVVFVVVPLALISVISGIVQSLGSAWGFLRHWWMVFKLILIAFAALVLTEYTSFIIPLASLAAHPVVSSATLAKLQDTGHGVHSAGGLAVLTVITALGVIKPRSMTRRGQRQQLEQRRRHEEQRKVLQP